MGTGTGQYNIYFANYQEKARLDSIAGYKSSVILNRFMTKWSLEKSTGASNFAKQFLDYNLWKTYANNDYSLEAVGTPPVELYYKSYHSKYPKVQLNLEVNNNGYYSGITYNSGAVITDTSGLSRMPSSAWKKTNLILAGPCALDNNDYLISTVYDNGYFLKNNPYCYSNSYSAGFRPVVVL